MLRRVVSTAAARPAVPVRQFATTHISDGIGNGKVVALKFDYLRPAYLVPTYPKQFVVNWIWTQVNHLPNYILCAILIFAAHGGFSGHLPPDPHELWH